jgi:hypothetical protein
MTSSRRGWRAVTLGAAWAAAALGFVVGLAYAAVSVYWAAGGTGLLDTVGGAFGSAGRPAEAAMRIGLWAVVVAKIAAAVLPVLALGRSPARAWQRSIWLLAWAEAVVLTSYGLVLTIPGLLIQAGVLHPGRGADHRALEWHAYLWDPWFLLWGLLVGAALLCGQSGGLRRVPPQVKDKRWPPATVSRRAGCPGNGGLRS